MRFLCIMLCVFIGSTHSLVAAQQPSQKPSVENQQPLVLDLSNLVYPNNGVIPLSMNSGGDNEYQKKQQFDVDGDGVPELELQTAGGRGPLSTYFTGYRFVVVNHAKILKGGAPMKPGDSIVPADLAHAGLSVQLCSVGGSLRFPNESFEKFSGGLWWGVENKPLPMCIYKDDGLKVGYVLVTVTKRGDVKIGKPHVQEIDFKPIKAPGK